MGQRSQIILLDKEEGFKDKVKTEEYKLVGVWHNQWNYGIGFITTLNDLLSSWNSGVEKLKNQNRFYEWRACRLASDLISYVNTKHFPETRGYFEIDINYKESNSCKNIWDIFFKFCDNNNGYIVLLIDKDKLKYDIIGGTENFEIEKRISATQYLKAFYPTDKDLALKDFSPKEVHKILDNIKQFQRFNSTNIILNKEMKVK